MKALSLIVASLALWAGQASAQSFSFGYTDIFASGADNYIVNEQSVEKYSYPYNSPPITFWGPSANDVPASLTQEFSFTEPATNIFLHAELASYNFVWGNAHGYFGSGTGSDSLWASTDGTNWQLLLNNPMPTNGVDSYQTYSQNVPSSLLGSTCLWIQVQMEVDGAPNTTYTTAQFSRSTSAETSNHFEIDAYLIPEPTTFALVLGALGCLLPLSRRKQRG